MRRSVVLAACIALGTSACDRGEALASAPTVSEEARLDEPYGEAPDGSLFRYTNLAKLKAIEIVPKGLSPDEELPIVVMLHGLADKPRLPSAFTRHPQRPVRVILPRGPYVFEQGFAWYPYRAREGKHEEMRVALEGTAAGPLPGADACLEALTTLLARHAIDCDLELGGCWVVRHQPAADASAPRWPDDDAGWLVVDHTEPGGALDPGKLAAGLARAAQRAGAVLHEHAPVEALGPSLVRVCGREVAAERIVVATNAFLPRLVPRAALRPALTYAIATAPLAPAALASVGLGATPFYTADHPYLWGRATRAGRLVVGAGLAFDEEEQRVERIAIDRADVRAALDRLVRRVRGLHSALAEIEITHAWGGPIAFRPGAVPILAELAPGVLAAGACAGHGVALSAALAALAARWTLDGEPLPDWGRVDAEPTPIPSAR